MVHRASPADAGVAAHREELFSDRAGWNGPSGRVPAIIMTGPAPWDEATRRTMTTGPMRPAGDPTPGCRDCASIGGECPQCTGVRETLEDQDDGDDGDEFDFDGDTDTADDDEFDFDRLMS